MNKENEILIIPFRVVLLLAGKMSCLGFHPSNEMLKKLLSAFKPENGPSSAEVIEMENTFGAHK